jgi:hypothetical protein
LSNESGSKSTPVTALGVAGRTLQAVAVDHTARLQLSGGYFIVIESAFSLAVAARTVTLTPGSDAQQASDLLHPLVG